MDWPPEGLLDNLLRIRAVHHTTYSFATDYATNEDEDSMPKGRIPARIDDISRHAEFSVS
jgi:hypothetical protein